MTIQESCPKHRGKGRPRSGTNDGIYDRLLEAAARGLAETVHTELTNKGIAEAAGATEAMIQYYFGSKDGLVRAVLESSVSDVNAGLQLLKKDILTTPGNKTLRLIRTLHHLAEPHAAATRLHMAEMLRGGSSLRKVCGLPQLDVFRRVKEVVQVLVDGGVYSKDLDVHFAAFTIMTLLSAPILNAPALRDRGINEAELNTDAWLGYCAGMLDRQFRNPWNPAEGEGTEAH